MSLIRLLLIVVLGAALTGCSTIGGWFGSKNQVPVEDLTEPVFEEVQPVIQEVVYTDSDYLALCPSGIGKSQCQAHLDNCRLANASLEGLELADCMLEKTDEWRVADYKNTIDPKQYYPGCTKVGIMESDCKEGVESCEKSGHDSKKSLHSCVHNWRKSLLKKLKEFETPLALMNELGIEANPSS